MGDRTFVRIEFRKSDLPKAKEVFGMDLEDLMEEDDGETVVANLHEMNYGASEECEELAKVIPFIGSHEAGGGYGPHHFCAVRGKYFQIEVNHDGHYFLAVDENGKPVEKKAIRKIKAYAKAEARAMKALRTA